ncbi:MAG: PucR family transcriptional regulator [Negativicutes bacterium]
MDRDFGLSIKEVLALEAFGGTKVVGGQGGLHQIVHSVNVMEVPDIFEWVQAGELLITTGYAIRDNQEAQRELIPKLAAKGLAGLAIKPRRFLEVIPQAMIEQADVYDFPLLELPAEVSFAKLISPILSGIVNKQNDFLSHSLQVHQKFMEIVSHGGTLKDMADCLAQLVENTTMIYDAVHDCSVWDGMPWSKQMIAEEANFEFGLQAEIPDQYQKKHIEMKNVSCDYLEVPILSGNEVYGKVLVFETNRPLTPGDIQTMERLSTVAALKILNLLAFDQIERRYANEFLDQILFSKLEAEWITRAKFFGWDLTISYIAFVLQIENSRPLSDEDGEKRMMLTNGRILKEITRYYKTSREVITGTKGDHVVLLMEIHNRDLASARQEAAKQTELLRRELNARVGGETITIGIGRYHEGVGGFQKSYNEAIRALRIGKEIGFAGRDVHFNDLGVYRLLVLLETREEMKAYLQDYISRLIAYDEDKNTELVKTLTMYFRFRGNIRKISQELYTHYNTILYRIERIQKITGLNLEENEDLINLEIALKIQNLLEKKESALNGNESVKLGF